MKRSAYDGRRFTYELRKLLALPVLWACFGLCLGFNLLLVSSNGGQRGLFNDASATAAQLGTRIDGTFLERLPSLPGIGNRELLHAAAVEYGDWMDAYDTEALFASYVAEVQDSPLACRWMAWKYEAATRQVEALRAAGAGQDFYAGPATHDSHQFLFGLLLRAVVTEGAALGMLSVLYLLGCEDISRTAGLLCASRTGRRQWKTKTGAGMLGALLLWLLLAGLSLLAYFSLWDYGGIWASSVCSSFNYVREGLTVKPFLTWGGFTVASYLAASLALGAALVLVCCLTAAVAGFRARNAYLAALSPAALGGAGLLLAVHLGQVKGLGTAFALACFQPVILWLDEGIWFTESGIRTVIPWQEPVTAALWLLLAALALGAAWRRFLRKDI